MSDLNFENYDFGVPKTEFDAKPSSEISEEKNLEELRSIWAQHLVKEQLRSEEEFALAHPLQVALHAHLHLFH